MTVDISQIKIPSSPGIYLMKDSDKKIIYIGKAKNLKNRVKSYFLKNQNVSPVVSVHRFDLYTNCLIQAPAWHRRWETMYCDTFPMSDWPHQ